MTTMIVGLHCADSAKLVLFVVHSDHEPFPLQLLWLHQDTPAEEIKRNYYQINGKHVLS